MELTEIERSHHPKRAAKLSSGWNLDEKVKQTESTRPDVKKSIQFATGTVECNMDRFVLDQSLAREVLSEFMGTFILCFINIAAPINLQLSGVKDVFLGNVCSAAGVFLGMVTAMSNSNAHLNPCVTTSFAARGVFKWRKVPYYIAAQYLGAFAAAFAAFVNFVESLNKIDGGVRSFAGQNGTGGAFAAIPADNISLFTICFDTIICSSLLLFAICAITDKRNSNVPLHMYAPFVAFAVFGIVSTMSHNCGVLMNPARDLGPRLFTMLAGYGIQGFTAHFGVFWIIGALLPHIGGVLGTFIYDLTIGIQRSPEEPDSGESIPVLNKTPLNVAGSF